MSKNRYAILSFSPTPSSSLNETGETGASLLPSLSRTLVKLKVLLNIDNTYFGSLNLDPRPAPHALRRFRHAAERRAALRRTEFPAAAGWGSQRAQFPLLYRVRLAWAGRAFDHKLMGLRLARAS